MSNDLAGRKVEKILISRATPGMVLARDIYSRNNQVILNSGSVLDAQKISKIMFYSIDTVSVYIDEKSTATQTLTQQLKDSVEFREFTRNYDRAVGTLKSAVSAVVNDGAEFDIDALIADIDHMIKESGSRTRLFNLLHCIRDYDEMTYMHCVNVSLISNCFGRWLGLDEADLRTLTLAGLLHDIGKTAIPKEILLKPSSLTEEEFKTIKTHTFKGYEILRDKTIDDRIKMAALQHHERADGSGYPYGKSGDEIESFAMIVAIADVYDAMTSDRVYRPKMCPFEVVKHMQSDTFTKYDPKFLVPLLEQITEVFMNHTVRLSNNQIGKIVLLNKNELSKPIIQVDDIFVDLSKQRDVTITEVL